MDLPVPTLTDVLKAKKQIAPYLRPTPLYRYPALCRAVGTDTWVKHENHQPVGAFKVRGGVNLISQMPEEERARGVIAASTGNHGQSVAYAANLFGINAVICVPAEANPVKVEAMRSLGAEVICAGADFDEARAHAERLASDRGYRYIHSGNEPLLIAGVGTYALEIMEDQPDIDVIVVPVGGGSGAAATAIAARGVNPAVRVIGVQSASAPAAYNAWATGQMLSAPNTTFAEGLSTGAPFALPQRIMRELLDDFLLVEDDAIRAAMLLMLEGTRNLVEAAGAAALAGVLHIREALAGKRVAVVCSGSNISLAQLRDLLGSAQP